MGVFRLGSFLGFIDNIKTRKWNISCDVCYDKVDVVALDFNAAIHDIAARLLKDDAITEITPDVLAKASIDYIQMIDAIYQPKTLIVAVDGVPPVGKINQQRMRRLAYPLPESNPKKWSPIYVSVDTEHMRVIHKYMLEYVKDKKNIVYSSMYEKGEGEHKLMDYIRANVSVGRILIFSEDSDMVLISMMAITDTRDIIVYRGNRYILIKEVRDIIYHTFAMEPSDFVFITFLCGNDFLPAIPEFGDIRKALTIMCYNYGYLKRKNKSFSLTNPVSFTSLYQLLSSIDMARLAPTNLLSYKKGSSFNYAFFIFTYENYIKETISDEMVSNFLVTMKWNLEYYRTNNVSYSHSYRYHSAPLLYNIIKYINKERKMIDKIVVPRKIPYPVTERQLKLVTIPPWFNMIDEFQQPDLFPYSCSIEDKIYSIPMLRKDGTVDIISNPHSIVPYIEYERLIKL